MSSQTMEYIGNASHANTTNLPLVCAPDDDEFFQATTPVQRCRCLDLSTVASKDASMMLKRTIELVNKYDVSIPRMLQGEINTHVREAGHDVDGLTANSRNRSLLENDPFSDPFLCDYDEPSEAEYADWEAKCLKLDMPQTPINDGKRLVRSCSTPTLIERINHTFSDRSTTLTSPSALPRRGQKPDRGSHVPNHKDRYNLRSISEWMVVSVLFLMMVAYNEHLAISAECMTTPASLNPFGRGIDDIKIGAVSVRASAELRLMDGINVLPVKDISARGAENVLYFITNKEQEPWHWASSLIHCG